MNTISTLKRLYHHLADPRWDGHYGTYAEAVSTCRGKGVHDERYVKKAVAGLTVDPCLTDGWRWVFGQLLESNLLQVLDVGSGAGTFRRLANLIYRDDGVISPYGTSTTQYDTRAMFQALREVEAPFNLYDWREIVEHSYDVVLCHNALQFFERPDDMLFNISNLKTKQVILADIPTSDQVTPYVTVLRWPWWKVNAVDMPMWVLPKQRLVRDIRRMWPGWTMAHKEINSRQYWSVVKQ